MIPPTSIDGTDITGATIDGTDVQEITVDGDVVFSAESLPVAYSNLIAWYPFDSSEYGGSNADDVTAIFNPSQSGDSTAYDGTVQGATYQSSAGVTDINAGNNSGAYEFDGSDDKIDLGSNFSETSHTKCGWFKTSDNIENQTVFGAYGLGSSKYTNLVLNRGPTDNRLTYIFDDGNVSADIIIDVSYSTNDYSHAAITYDASGSTNNCELYVNGVSQDTASKSSGLQMLGDEDELIGNVDTFGFLNGYVDDYRIYNKALSTAEIEQIVENTQDPNAPVFP